METEDELRVKYYNWCSSPLESLVHKAIISTNGVSYSKYHINGRIAALIVCVYPKVNPWKQRVQHYFDENCGNDFSAIKGQDFSFVLNHAFEVAKTGNSSVFVIYDIPLVIISSVVEHQIKKLEEDFIL